MALEHSIGSLGREGQAEAENISPEKCSVCAAEYEQERGGEKGVPFSRILSLMSCVTRPTGITIDVIKASPFSS